MRTHTICLALAIVLICPFASAQWVNTNCPWSPSSSASLLTVIGTSLYVGTYSEYGDGILMRSRDNGNRWDTLAIWPKTRGFKGDRGWTQLISVDTILVASLQEINLMSGNSWYIVRSTDGGHTWTDTTLTDYVVGFLQMGSHLYAFEQFGPILSSANGGVTWETVKQVGLPTDDISSVVSKGAMMFCGTGNNGIFRSTSFGESWDSASAGLNLDGRGVFGVEDMVAVSDTIFCRFQKNVGGYYPSFVFRSTNDGMIWSNASSGLSGGEFLDILGSSGHLLFAHFAGTSSGLFVSTNRGDSWNLWSEGLPYIPAQIYYHVNSMVFSDSFAFVGIEGGLWRRPLTEIPTSVQTLLDEIPNQFSLHQNYPNPFNPSTTIKYESPKSAEVRLAVFDILGREVSVLVNERKNAGSYQVKFDGTGLSSGVYFYRLQTGDFTQTKRLLFLK